MAAEELVFHLTPNQWNAVGAVGSWAGAIATFTAAIVALYLGLRSTKEKVKVTAQVVDQLYFQTEWETRPDQTQVFAKNVGSVPVVVGVVKVTLGWHPRFKKRRFCVWVGQPDHGRFELPTRSEVVSWSRGKDSLKQVLEPLIEYIVANRVPYFELFSLRIGVQTMSSKNYFCWFPKKARLWLWAWCEERRAALMKSA